MKILKTKCALLALFTALIFNSCKSPTYVYENSGHAITMEKSKNLYKNYNDNIKPEVEKVQKKLVKRDTYEGTEYVLVSIQQLENYIRFLKQVEKTNKDNQNNKVTGIAIFLGAHTKTKTLKSIPKFNSKIKDYDGMNEQNDRLDGDMRHRITTFLAPTYRDSEEKDIKGNKYTNEFERHIPFFIEYNNSNNKYKGSYKHLVPYLRNNKNATRSVERNSSLNADEFNIMPPRQ